MEADIFIQIVMQTSIKTLKFAIRIHLYASSLNPPSR